MKFAAILLTAIFTPCVVLSQELPLPPRPAEAIKGKEFVALIESLDLQLREEKILSEILSGNVPGFLRTLSAITTTNVSDGKTNTATYFVKPDYLAVGSDEDYFLTPMTPLAAQRIADALNCTLPTRKMVNDIFSNAPVKLSPSPIPPTPAMTTVPVFRQHNDIVRKQRFQSLEKFPLGMLTAGHKKDVVITTRLAESPGKVAIYGWHQTNGIPIQPLYLGHAATWADYSHGIRLVQKQLVVNGVAKTVDEVLGDTNLAGLLSDEGVIAQPKYIANKIAAGKFQASPFFDEQTMLLEIDNGVRVLINAPSPELLRARKKLKLIFYGLPNGNTIEQTAGRKMKPEDDWHFDIQHIGAQTRFLREKLKEENIVVAYLENSLKAWPSWRKKFGDKQIPEIFDTVKKQFTNAETKIVLTGHSGGGSLTFGFLNCFETIPDEIERIAFLDSNYAYDTALHRDKLVNWLKKSDASFLTVLAYHDSIALLDGKTFVSAEGGTWGRSHLMKKDFETEFEFKDEISPEFKKHFALNRRLQFLLKENQEKKIFHTVQVERNGFIHAMLTGTPLENEGYEYFGPRAYTNWIQPE